MTLALKIWFTSTKSIKKKIWVFVYHVLQILLSSNKVSAGMMIRRKMISYRGTNTDKSIRPNPYIREYFDLLREFISYNGRLPWHGSGITYYIIDVWRASKMLTVKNLELKKKIPFKKSILLIYTKNFLQ